MRVGSLFTGLGGLDLGLPGDPAWMCEYDKHARRVLEQRFPGVPVYPDVRELDDTVPPVDMLVGGYPCQPFSVAGKRGAEADPRHLWPEFARLIRVLRPRLVFAENVSGHLALGFDRVLCDLAEAGFDAEWVVVRASDVGAPHRRERLFVLASDAERVRVDADRRVRAGDARSGGEGRRSGAPADPDRVGRSERPQHDGRPNEDAAIGSGRDMDRVGLGQPERPRVEGGARGARIKWGTYEPAIRRWELVLGRAAPRPTDDRGRLMAAFVEWMMGLPEGWVSALEVSRTQQLKMLGNAVVPQQAALACRILAGVLDRPSCNPRT